jgi:hypothetical protein
MRFELLICPLVMLTAWSAAAESLEERFGPDRERGYRPERGIAEARRGFENRDRANFLGVSHSSHGDEPAAPLDPHRSLPAGLRR